MWRRTACLTTSARSSSARSLRRCWPLVWLFTRTHLERRVRACTAQVAQALIPAVTAIVPDQLTPQLSRVVADYLTESLSSLIGNALNEHLTPRLSVAVSDRVLLMTPPRVAQLIGIDLGVALSKAVVHALVPALVHTLSHQPLSDYFCYYCFHQQLYCEYCQYAPSQVYWASYYAGYFSSYYSRTLSSVALCFMSFCRSPLSSLCPRRCLLSFSTSVCSRSVHFPRSDSDSLTHPVLCRSVLQHLLQAALAGSA